MLMEVKTQSNLLSDIELDLNQLDFRYDSFRVLYTNFLYFLNYRVDSVATVICQVLKDEIKNISEGNEEISSLYNRVNQLNTTLLENPDWDVLKSNIPYGYDFSQQEDIREIIISYINQIKNLVYVTKDETPRYFSNIEQKLVCQAVTLLGKLHMYVFSSEKALKQKKSPNMKHWTKEYFNSLVNKKAYYSSKLTKNRVEVASNLLNYIQVVLQQAHGEQAIFSIMMSFYVTQAYENNSNARKAENKKVLLLKNSHGELHKILKEARSSFQDELKQILYVKSQELSPSAKVLLNELLNNKDGVDSESILNLVNGHHHMEGASNSI